MLAFKTLRLKQVKKLLINHNNFPTKQDTDLTSSIITGLRPYAF